MQFTPLTDGSNGLTPGERRLLNERVAMEVGLAGTVEEPGNPFLGYKFADIQSMLEASAITPPGNFRSLFVTEDGVLALLTVADGVVGIRSLADEARNPPFDPSGQIGVLVEEFSKAEPPLIISLSLRRTPELVSLYSIPENLLKINEVEDVSMNLAEVPAISPGATLYFPGSGRLPLILDQRTPIIFGREIGCAVCISDPAVSRFQALIGWRQEGYFIQDLGSYNGTHLNGEPLTAGQEHSLADGDRIRICDTTVTFSEDAGPDSSVFQGDYSTIVGAAVRDPKERAVYRDLLIDRDGLKGRLYSLDHRIGLGEATPEEFGLRRMVVNELSEGYLKAWSVEALRFSRGELVAVRATHELLSLDTSDDVHRRLSELLKWEPYASELTIPLLDQSNAPYDQLTAEALRRLAHAPAFCCFGSLVFEGGGSPSGQGMTTLLAAANRNRVQELSFKGTPESAMDLTGLALPIQYSLSLANPRPPIRALHLDCVDPSSTEVFRPVVRNDAAVGIQTVSIYGASETGLETILNNLMGPTQQSNLYPSKLNLEFPLTIAPEMLTNLLERSIAAGNREALRTLELRLTYKMEHVEAAGLTLALRKVFPGLENVRFVGEVGQEPE